MEAGSYSPLQGKGSHGQSTGLSGKVLFLAALRLPYLLGTTPTMRGRLPDGAAAPGSGLPPADPYGGSLSTTRKAVGASIPPDMGTY